MSARHGHVLDDSPGLRVRREEGMQAAARISLHGCLDGANGECLMAAVDSLAGDGLTHIRLDLRGITGYTDDGVSAAFDCSRRAAELPCGVSFLVCAGTSRTALLEIFARG